MQTAERLEEAAEAGRAQVEDTLNRLKERMSVEQMVGSVGRFMGVEDAGDALRSLGRHMQANPVPVGMIGLGLAWLAFGGSRPATSPTQWNSRRWKGPDAAGDGGQAGARMSYMIGAARDRMQHGMDRVGESMDDMSSRASDMAGSARTRVEDGMGRMRDRADELRHGMVSQMEDKPLLIGGLAMLVGTVVAVALPRTRTEDSLMGPQRAQLMEGAREASATMRDRVTDAAQRTYDTAVDSAREEGLLPKSEGTITSKLTAVAEATMEEAKRQIDPVLHGRRDEGKAAE